MKKKKIHYKVSVCGINLACGAWPYVRPYTTNKKRLWTKDKSEVTCGKCKKTLPYRIDNFDQAKLIDILIARGRKNYPQWIKNYSQRIK